MGTVFLAVDGASGRRVALKLLHGRIESRRLERFRREGEATAALTHPGIVRVHGAGYLEGLPYLIYEWVEGARPLDDVFVGRGLRERVSLVRDAARALGYAHARGIVHRDVKPENLLVDKEGRVRVTDFGLAQVDDGRHLTQTGAMLGTPYAMAPEQLEGRGGAGVDVWALGVLLYQALTGRHPFEGATMQELMAQLASARVEAPSTHAADVPPALGEICLRALSRLPESRPADGEALARELDTWLSGKSEARRRGVALPLIVTLLTCAIGALIAWQRLGEAPLTAARTPTPASSHALIPLEDAATPAEPVPIPARVFRLPMGEHRTQGVFLTGGRVLVAGLRDGGTHGAAIWKLGEGAAQRLVEWDLGSDLTHLVQSGRGRVCVGLWWGPRTVLELRPGSNPEWQALPTPKRVVKAGAKAVAVGELDGETWLATAKELRVYLWRSGDPEGSLVVLPVERPVHRLAISPDGRSLVGVQDYDGDHQGQVPVWRVPRGELSRIVELALHPNCVAFSPDSVRVAVGTRAGGLLLVTLASGEVRSLVGDDDSTPFRAAHRANVTGVQFGASGQRLYSVAYKKTPRPGQAPQHDLKVWDAASGEQLGRLRLDQGPITLAVDPLERGVLLGTPHGEVVYHPLPEGVLHSTRSR